MTDESRSVQKRKAVQRGGRPQDAYPSPLAATMLEELAKALGIDQDIGVPFRLARSGAAKRLVERWAAEKDNLDQGMKANRALFEQQRDKADALERDALTWQPIETAPRDSTPILVTGCNGGRVILYAQFFEERADESFKGPGWLGCFEGMQMWLAEPTHWMPLPTPPEAGTGGA